MVQISPLAPAAFPVLPPLAGTGIATAAAGIKYAGRTDVLLMLFPAGTVAAGVFTRSKCPSAPVDWCRAVLPDGEPRALLVNSGNANAFTGRRGRDATRMSAELTARAAGCRPDQVLLASTGVIGEPLEAERFAGVVERMASQTGPDGWADAAGAIMTTDTFPKGATRRARIGEATVTLNGIAKGAGMIAPDMATMLSFIVTDAPIAPSVLQSLLTAGVRDSFNAITVDSDTSTSDTVLLFATGTAADIDPIVDANDRRLGRFRRALNELMRDLAVQIVRDGEGARKLVEIRVTGAKSKTSARRIGKAIGNSPLVKTAIAGEDANWGRVVMAVGKAGEPADRDRIAIWFGDIRVAAEGERDPDYSESVASHYMKRDHIVLTVDLGLGRGRDTVWTCDLTKDYVAINGDYRS